MNTAGQETAFQVVKSIIFITIYNSFIINLRESYNSTVKDGHSNFNKKGMCTFLILARSTTLIYTQMNI